MLMPMRPYSPFGNPFGPLAPNVSAAEASPPRARAYLARRVRRDAQDEAEVIIPTHQLASVDRVIRVPNAQEFLKRVCKWVATEADAIERAQEATERDTVRADIAELLPFVGVLSEEARDDGATTGDALRRLCLAALEPNLPASKMSVL